MTICPHFGLCGGCSKQNVSYDEQLAAKEKSVRSHLGGINVASIASILPSPDLFFYRNKMEFSFGDNKDLEILARVGGPAPGFRSKARLGDDRATVAPPERRTTVHLGLHPKGRFALVTPTPDCRLLSEDSNRICAVVEAWATEKNVPVFVRKNGQGELRHLVVREGKNTGERMVNLVSKSTTPHVDDLAARLQRSALPITTFMWTPYDGLSDVAQGGEHKIYWGNGRIEERIGDLTFKVNPGSFMQTNTKAAEMMVGVLRHWMENESEGAMLIDLYCGSGTIGLGLSRQFDEVVGVEINAVAVVDARVNAEINNIANIRFLEGKAEDLAATLPVNEKGAGVTVVVDPPRAGLHPRLMETLLGWNIRSLYYVSCNPETLARDLRALSARYDILAAQPMDFFPHTDHIETAVYMKRSDT